MRRAGLPVMEYLPDRDKVSRVYAATPMMEAGKYGYPRVKSGQKISLEELYTVSQCST